ncbi:hypothetical protein BV20DRAFT_966785 [Pilatotrama ljubarskyi]|nr:hypothetical protein BV20DRAFT_966785 [Pilatotrama ljubarskyi]
MPLFGKSDTFSDNPEVRQVEKMIAKEARDDQKNLDHTIKDLSSAEKAHNKSVKAVDNAHHALDKAVEKEHKAAKAVNRAIHNHDSTVANEQAAEKKVEITKQHETRLEQDLEQKRRQLDELQHRKAQNDQLRESKLSQIHAQAAAAADIRRASFENGNQQQQRASVGGEPTSGAAPGSGDASAIPGVPSSGAAA